MINLTVPSVKSFGEFNQNTGTVSVTFTLVDTKGETFDFTRDVNAVTYSDGSLDNLLTMQRATQILSGLIHNCSIGILSKAKLDEQLEAEAKSAAIAAEIANKNTESEEIKAKMLASAEANAKEYAEKQAAEAAKTA